MKNFNLIHTLSWACNYYNGYMNITALLIITYPEGLKSVEFKLRNFLSQHLRKIRLAAIQKKIAKNRLFGENINFLSGNFFKKLYLYINPKMIFKKLKNALQGPHISSFCQSSIVHHSQTTEIYVYPYFLLLTLWTSSGMLVRHGTFVVIK